jgi:outer membrane murein-binding lipoprotein Lpp
MIGRRGPLHLTVAAALLSSTCLGGRDAGAQSNEELMRIIREQQRQIDELSRKVDALTGQTEAANDDGTGLWGGYLSASYFLTDDSRNYDAEDGVSIASMSRIPSTTVASALGS